MLLNKCQRQRNKLQNLFTNKGCTMGTICAPAYANIFMDHFERKYIQPFSLGLSLSRL